MEKEKNDVMNNITKNNENEDNTPKMQSNNKNEMKKKTNVSPILSLLFISLGIYLTIHSTFNHGSSYMWQLGLIFIIVVFIVPLFILSIILGIIGLRHSIKYKQGDFYKGIAILEIVVSIIFIIVNINQMYTI